MQWDLYHICYYLSGALSCKGDLSYRVHSLGSLQFRTVCKILFQVLPCNFFCFSFCFCMLFKPCLEDKIGHFLVGIVILLLHCSCWVKYIVSIFEEVMWYLHFIKQKWRLVVETRDWECLLIWGLHSMTRFLGLMHFRGWRHILCCWFQWVLRNTAIWVSGFEMKTEDIRNTCLVTSWVKIQCKWLP